MNEARVLKKKEPGKWVPLGATIGLFSAPIKTMVIYCAAARVIYSECDAFGIELKR